MRFFCAKNKLRWFSWQYAINTPSEVFVESFFIANKAFFTSNNIVSWNSTISFVNVVKKL